MRSVPLLKIIRRSILFLVGGALLVGFAQNAEPLERAARRSISSAESAADSSGEPRVGPAGLWVRWAAGAGRGGSVRGIARSSKGGIAIGDDSGVSWFETDAVDRIPAAQRRASLREVRDLRFDGRGRLWIATEAGLYRWGADGRPARRALRGGEGAPGLNSLAGSGRALVVAGDSGAYWSTTGDIFQPLDVGGVGTAVDWVALRPGSRAQPLTGAQGLRVDSGETVEVWLLGPTGLYRLAGVVTDSGLRVMDKERVSEPRPKSERQGIGLVVDPSGERLAVVYPDLIALRLLDEGSSLQRGTPSWHFVRPVLAPGAEIRSLVWGTDRVALSTDHGVFVASDLDAVFERAAAPVGMDDCVETLSEGDQAPWIALCRSGVYTFGREPSPNAMSRRGAEPALVEEDLLALEADPPVEEIRRRAFERAGLSAALSAKLWRGLRRRAFWPEVGLRFRADFDQDQHSDFDQAFVSGDTRELSDYGRDRSRGLGGWVSLDWDLGGLVYPVESVDLSRESRQVVSLRDDIADEINQLYFERARIRQRLLEIGAGQLAAEPGEETRLRWRAREIGAGLDAWTGGWLSRWTRDHALRRPATNFYEIPDPPVPLDKEE